MTDKQKRTADKYIQCGNKKEALIFGGYNPKYMAFFKLEEIRSYIEGKNPKIATSEEILEYCSKIMRGEEFEPVPIKEKDSEGKTIINIAEQPVSVATRIKVAELLGKRNGTFAEAGKTQNTLPIVIKDDLYE